LLLGFGVLFALRHPLAKSLMAGNLLAYSVVVIVFGLLIRKYVYQREDQKNKLDKTNIGLYKEFVNFGFWMILGNLAFVVLRYTDRWMLNRYVGASEVGIYAVVMGLSAMLSLAVQLIGHVLGVNLNYLWERGEKERCMLVLNTCVKTMLFIFLICSFFVLLLKDFLIGTLYGIEYLRGTSVVYVLLLTQVFMVIYSIMKIYPMLIEKTFIVCSAVAMGSLSNIALNYLLIPLYQMKGAAIASAASFVLIVGILLLLNRREGFRIDKRMFVFVAVSLLMLVNQPWIFGPALGLLLMIIVKTNLLFSEREKGVIFGRLRDGFRW